MKKSFPNPHQKVKSARTVVNEENPAPPPTEQKLTPSHREGCFLFKVKRNKHIEPTDLGESLALNLDLLMACPLVIWAPSLLLLYFIQLIENACTLTHSGKSLSFGFGFGIWRRYVCHWSNNLISFFKSRNVFQEFILQGLEWLWTAHFCSHTFLAVYP